MATVFSLNRRGRDMSDMKLVVVGAGGRMGRTLVADHLRDGGRDGARGC